MINIYCSKSFLNYFNLTVQNFENKEVKTINDWSAHLIKIGGSNKLIFVNHLTFLNLIFDENSKKESNLIEKFFNCLFSVINEFRILKDTERQKIVDKMKNFEFLNKSTDKTANNFLNNLSSLYRNSSLLASDHFIKIENGYENEEAVVSFLNHIL